MKALEISNLTKTYKNGVTALKGIDLDVDQGDFFALLGANGAGKSTTIGIITSLLTKTTGNVRVFGHDISDNVFEAKRCIGLVPQEYNCNIFEPCDHILINQAGYYGIPVKTARPRAHELLEKLGLKDKIHMPSKELSGGMKRRLTIARALVHQPKMLILDEPTAGVDIEIRHSMWEFLTELNQQGTTIILTTHYLEEAEHLCRNVGIISKGRLVKSGSMQSVMGQICKHSFVLELYQPLQDLPKSEVLQFKQRNPTELEINSDVPLSVNDIFDVLNANQIKVKSMRPTQNRLETLFLDVIQND